MNQSNVSRETLRTPSSYKVEAVKEMLNLRAHMFGTALALLVKSNWDVTQARYDTTPSSASCGLEYEIVLCTIRKSLPRYRNAYVDC